MKINELFRWAKAHNLENADIYIEDADGRSPAKALFAVRYEEPNSVCLCFMTDGFPDSIEQHKKFNNEVNSMSRPCGGSFFVVSKLYRSCIKVASCRKSRHVTYF